MKDKILELRQNNKTYQQIADILQISKSTVCYYLGDNQKQKYRNRRQVNRSKSHPYTSKFYKFVEPNIIKNRTNNIYSFKSSMYRKLTKFHNGGTLSFTVDDVIKKFGENPKCYLTGEEIDIYQPSTYQFDHIIPKSRGGQNTLDNLGLCTKQANMAKGNMTPDEFLNFCKKVINNQSNS